MKTILIGLFIVLSGCGFNGNQKFEVSDSVQHVVQEGESFTYVIVRLEYLTQIQQICEDMNPIEDFADISLRKKAVAECTIANMNFLNINLDRVGIFINQYCNLSADFTTLTPQQQYDLITACAALGQPLPTVSN